MNDANLSVPPRPGATPSVAPLSVTADTDPRPPVRTLPIRAVTVRGATAVLCSALISACGGGGDSTPSAVSSTPPPAPANPTDKATAISNQYQRVAEVRAAA